MSRLSPRRIDFTRVALKEALSGLSRQLRDSVEYRKLERELGRAERLPLPAAAWVGELLSRDLDRPLLVIVPHESDALAWTEASELFSGSAVYFSTPSLTPYHAADVSLQVRALESVALWRSLSGAARVLVCTPRALFRRLPSKEAFLSAVLEIKTGEEQPVDQLAGHLTRYGYHRTDLVTEVGEFAVRGGVFDLYSPGEETPVRLDLFGDTIESIRRFSVEDQRSSEPLFCTTILPLSLFPVGEETAEHLAEILVEMAGSEAGYDVVEKVEALRARQGFTGWENYLPLVATETQALTDWLDRPLVVAYSSQDSRSEVERYSARLEADFVARSEHRELAVEAVFLEQPPEVVEAILDSAELEFGLDVSGLRQDVVDFKGSTTDLFHGQLPRFPREVETARERGERLLVVSPREHWQRLEHWCRAAGIPLGRGGVELVDGELRRGFRLPAAAVVTFGEHQIFPRIAPERQRRRNRFGPFVSSLRDLRIGDHVVHQDHGIGQFVALRSVGTEEQDLDHLPPALLPLLAGEQSLASEVMEIAYESGRRLLLPLSRLDQIQRYSGIESMPPRLDQLGGTSWTRTKDRVRRGMQRLAGDLVKLYAERQLAKAPALPGDTDLMAQFEAAFEFEETEDQRQAIDAIKEDLERERPMDRLLCGDVGFGKTEVAMRAAFKAVEGGYQVAVLAPTTILADQHLETFRRRFDGYPVRVEMLSRRRTAAEVKEIRQGLTSGEVDILIGTHRLLGRDVELPKLGLLIVDEEQRFGVAQKERLRELKKNVHVLAMSATPVPRTLQLSLAGVRDLSVIETPPRDRMAVETAIMPFSPELVREAVEFELERRGQVYYVFNRVEGIEQFAAYLRELLPAVRMTIGHGQMEENELARRMHAFKKGEYDLLLATTIIENGIDIPNVNTILVHQAERFGLAQLYQLRGRVGRSDQLAYCYLLVPGDRVLRGEARKRLHAIREFTELGAGFRVAARDLEIRGAGNLLGAEQSGHIAAVGIETYLKMLEETVRELRGEAVEAVPSVALDLPLNVTIPSDYLSDANLRMEIYQRIASGDVDTTDLLDELQDRFGPPPPSVYGLLAATSLKRLAEAMRVQSISHQGQRLQIRFRRDSSVDVERLVRMVSERPGLTFSPSGILILDQVGGAQALERSRWLLEELGK